MGKTLRGLFTSRWLVVLYGIVLGAAASVAAFNLVPEQRYMERPVQHAFGAGDPQFPLTMEGVLGARIDRGTSVQTLVNGDEIFPAMLEAIAAAQETVHFETYIYWDGAIAVRFAELLAAKALEGVEVRIILDAVGSARMDTALIDAMEAGGATVVRFRPLRWYTLDRWNHRTHRKILVTDGTVGFTGGVGVGDEWTGDARNPDEWRENHYRLQGPAVSGLQSAFAENWLEATGEVLKGDRYFPVIEPAGNLATQPMKTSARSGSESAHLAVLMALASAERHVRIAMAYFVPNEIAIDQIVALRERGVVVEIILPGEHQDVTMVRHASRQAWGPLLAAGVRILEYGPTMYHPKVLIVDESFASIGSVNFDERSFRLNDELNVNVYDEEFAQTQIDIFEDDLSMSRPVTFEEWQNRPLREQVLDRFWSLFESQL